MSRFRALVDLSQVRVEDVLELELVSDANVSNALLGPRRFVAAGRHGYFSVLPLRVGFDFT